jgi:dolichol-phosphate mannosyltransferase
MLHILYIKTFTNEAVPGWATIGAGVFFLVGVQFIFFGIIGEYIARIFEEIKQRPLYIIKDQLKKGQINLNNQHFNQYTRTPLAGTKVDGKTGEPIFPR